MKRPETTDSKGLDVTKALTTFFFITMNKSKRAARKRKREKESLQLARTMDRRKIHGVYERVRLHNALANRGIGMVVDSVWVREYYESRRTIVEF